MGGDVAMRLGEKAAYGKEMLFYGNGASMCLPFNSAGGMSNLRT